MNRILLASVMAILVPALALAHMVYVVPSGEGKLTVVFSDSLEPDLKVAIDKVAGLKLSARMANGKDMPVEVKKGDHKLTAEVPTDGVKFVQGSVIYGISTKVEKPSILVYHPKAVMAGVTATDATIGEKAALEIVPFTAGGKTRFQLLAKGQPVADAEGTVMMADGKKEPVKTNKEGFTEGFSGAGRFAAYLKLVEAKPGEHEGKKYDEIRHYATLVVDVK
jgi:uncharacterized GH25 family protein